MQVYLLLGFGFLQVLLVYYFQGEHLFILHSLHREALRETPFLNKHVPFPSRSCFR